MEIPLRWLAKPLSLRLWQSGIWKNIPVSKNTDALCFLYSAVPPPFCGSSVAPCLLPSNMVCWQQLMAWPVKGEGLMRGRFCRETVVSVLSSRIHSKIWKGSAYKYPLSHSVTQLWFRLYCAFSQGSQLSWPRVPDLLDAVLGECQEKQHQPQEPWALCLSGVEPPTGRVAVDLGGGGVRWDIKHSFLAPADSEPSHQTLNFPVIFLMSVFPFLLWTDL